MPASLHRPVRSGIGSAGLSLMVKLPLVAGALYFAWRARRRWELAALLAVLAAAAVLVSLPPPR